MVSGGNKKPNAIKMLRKVSENLFYLFVFLLPWQTVWIVREVFYGGEKWQYGTIGIYVSDLALVLWLVLSGILYYKNIRKYIAEKKYIFLSALSIVAWVFVSSLWANDYVLSLYFATILLLAFALFLFIQCAPFSLRAVINIFVVSVALQSVIGLAQFITQHTFAQKFLGLSYHNIWSGGNAVISVGSERWLRDYGAMPHPNIFGALLVVAILITVGLYANSSREKFSAKKLFYLSAIGLFTINLLFTFSRSAWLMALIGILSVMIWQRHFLSRKKILPVIGLIFGLVMTIIILMPNLFLVRVERDTSFTHNSIGDRRLYLRQAFSEISRHPFRGVGAGNYTKAVFDANGRAQPIWFYQPAHNVFVLIWAELGLVGIILLVVFLGLIFYDMLQGRKNFSAWQKVFLVAVVVLLLQSMVEHWLWTTHFGLLFFFLLLGLLLGNCDFRKIENICTTRTE